MRHERGSSGGTRASALWGKGSKSESRSSALWGKKGGRSAVTFASLAVALTLPVAGLASGGSGGSGSNEFKAFVPAPLLSDAQANPDKAFNVIVQAEQGKKSKDIADDVSSNGKLKRSFRTVQGVSATLTGKQLVQLARNSHISAITADQKLSVSGAADLMWQDSAGVKPLIVQPKAAVACATSSLTGLKLDPSCVPAPAVLAPQAPGIAIIDSGVDATKLGDFGNRIVASLNFSSLTPNAVGDGEGHGTMVAGIAAGSSAFAPGAAPNAPIVSLRTSDDQGQSQMSDVLAAIDWVAQNAAQYNIRVVNMSLTGSGSDFRYDPVDRAVENLWFNKGIVVVAAVGNNGNGSSEVTIGHPANDPFVLAVGALDQNGTANPADDFVAPWSSYGHSDGFARPDVSAPGRSLVMPVPMDSTIAKAVPDRILAPGYMWMSGTSFAAPLVAGAAAQILARHPGWTPDQVKGALMLTAKYLSNQGIKAGVGEINAAAANAVASPPNPNSVLENYVSVDSATGDKTFDQAGWTTASNADPTINQAEWNQAEWNQAEWNQAEWNQAEWNQAEWNQAEWNQAEWNQAEWNQAEWNQAEWNQAEWNQAEWNQAEWNQAILAP
jgi:serine protease AprX